MSVVNTAGGQGRVPKLSEVLFERSSRSFRSLAPLPSNIDAIEAGLRFTAGLHTLLAITGPSGWGKTHLLEAVTYRLSHELGTPVERLRAADLAASPSKAEHATPLVLDDVQEVLGRPRPQLALRLTLERRVRTGRPTIVSFTLPKPNRQIRGFLPNFREWTVATIGEPEAEERVLLLDQMAAGEGLSLAPCLSRIIADSMYGNGRTLAGALKRLKLTGGAWSDPATTLRACGLLDPFFADNSDWDLKLKILKVAEQNRGAFPKASITDLALVAMLHEACLAESDIARCMGISPASVYLRAAKFKAKADVDPVLSGYMVELVNRVVEAL